MGSWQTAALVLAADDPAALARFYGALLAEPPRQGLSAHHWRLRLPEAGWLEIYAPSASRPLARQVGRLALCLRRRGLPADLEPWLAEAQAQGARLLEGPRREPFGAEAWLLDPEGNRLLLLVLDEPAPPREGP